MLGQRTSKMSRAGVQRVPGFYATAADRGGGGFVTDTARLLWSSGKK